MNLTSAEYERLEQEATEAGMAMATFEAARNSVDGILNKLKS